MQSIGDIIANARRKMHLTQPELQAKLAENGKTNSYKSISSWEKNQSEPSVSTFLTLCKILEIDDPVEAYFGYNPQNRLSQLNEIGKEKVLEYVDLLIHSHLYDKPQTEILPFSSRKIRIYSAMASAGTGNFIESDEYELAEVGNEVPENADFGVKISGDSMEPRFVNHQIVWVHAQNSIENGEIGIFWLNGNAYCKKLKDDADGLFLISLNKKYAPIPVKEEDSFKIFGKILV